MSDYSVHASSFVEDGVKIGKGTHIWHFCHVRKGASIGENCNIGQNVFIDCDVVIGNGCKLQNNVSVYTGVTLEDNVFCGPSMVFTNDLNPRAKYPKDPNHRVQTLVKRGATIGANATIVCGVALGENCFISAGAVVTHDVPPNAMVAGVPAKIIGYMCECGSKLDKNKKCNNCGRQY